MPAPSVRALRRKSMCALGPRLAVGEIPSEHGRRRVADGLADRHKLQYAQSALPGFVLRDERLRCFQPICDGLLCQPLRQPGFSQHLSKELFVRRVR